MKTAMIILAALALATAALADDYTIRKSSYGITDRFSAGVIVKNQGGGKTVVRRELVPGSGIVDRFERGTVIENDGDEITVREELIPGTGIADPFGDGYIIERD